MVRRFTSGNCGAWSLAGVGRWEVWRASLAQDAEGREGATAAIPVGAIGEFTDATSRARSDDAPMAKGIYAINSHDPHGGVLHAPVPPELAVPLRPPIEERSPEISSPGGLLRLSGLSRSRLRPSIWLSRERGLWQLSACSTRSSLNAQRRSQRPVTDSSDQAAVMASRR
jgi:hypothetical protein